MESLCGKDTEILMYSLGFSYAAIVKRYYEHKDNARFLNELTMALLLRTLKDNMQGKTVSALDTAANAMSVAMVTASENLRKENEELKKQIEELRSASNKDKANTDAEYDKLKKMYDEAMDDNKDLKDTIREQDDKIYKLDTELNNLKFHKEVLEPEREKIDTYREHEEEECQKDEYENPIEEIVCAGMAMRFVYNIMINDICCCTVYRTFEDPPTDQNNQITSSYFRVDKFINSLQDILNYDAGTAIVTVGNKCLYNGEICQGDFEVIDDILDKAAAILGEDTMERPTYINFEGINQLPNAKDLEGGIYFTFIFKENGKPVVVKMMRVDAPIVQAMKSAERLIGRKVQDPVGNLHKINNIEIHTVYDTLPDITKATGAEIVFDNDVQDVRVSRAWCEQKQYREEFDSPGNLYFINLYYASDNSTMGCIVKADSFHEVSTFVRPAFTSDKDFARVYLADSTEFIGCINASEENQDE